MDRPKWTSLLSGPLSDRGVGYTESVMYRSRAKGERHKCLSPEKGRSQIRIPDLTRCLFFPFSLDNGTLKPGWLGREREREFFVGNLLVQIHLIIVMIRWTSLAP